MAQPLPLGVPSRALRRRRRRARALPKTTPRAACCGAVGHPRRRGHDGFAQSLRHAHAALPRQELERAVPRMVGHRLGTHGDSLGTHGHGLGTHGQHLATDCDSLGTLSRPATHEDSLGTHGGGRHQRGARADELAGPAQLAACDRLVQRRVASLVARADAAPAREHVCEGWARLVGLRAGARVGARAWV